MQSRATVVRNAHLGADPFMVRHHARSGPAISDARHTRVGEDGDMSEVDAYNLPVGLLGRHPEEFYGAMGRVVCICALLEDKVGSLRHALERVEQGRFTHEPVSAQIKASRRLSQDLPDPAPSLIGAFLDKAQVAFDSRNELVHSSFPAQASGQIWGHRAARDKSVTDGSTDTVVTSIEQMRAFIRELSTLVTDFNHVYAWSASRSVP